MTPNDHTPEIDQVLVALGRLLDQAINTAGDRAGRDRAWSDYALIHGAVVRSHCLGAVHANGCNVEHTDASGCRRMPLCTGCDEGYDRDCPLHGHIATGGDRG